MAKKEQKKVCFAVTPIGGEGTEIRRRSDQVLKYIIEPVMADLGYEVVRADRISQPGMITHQVIEHLIDGDLVVADLTGSNPNVFYELAIRHATRKPIVTMIEDGERIPFDVNQSRTIQFTYQDLDSVYACKSELASQAHALVANPTDFFTPVSVAIDLKAMYESGIPEERRDAQVLAVLQEVQAEMSQLGTEVARLRDRVERPRYTVSASSPTIGTSIDPPSDPRIFRSRQGRSRLEERDDALQRIRQDLYDEQEASREIREQEALREIRHSAQHKHKEKDT